MVKFNFGLGGQIQNTEDGANTSSGPVSSSAVPIKNEGKEPLLEKTPAISSVESEKKQDPKESTPPSKVQNIQMPPVLPKKENIQLKDKTTIPTEPSPKKFELRPEEIKVPSHISEKQEVIRPNPNEIFPRKGMVSNANLIPSFSIKKKEEDPSEEKPSIPSVVVPTQITKKEPVASITESSPVMDPLETLKKIKEGFLNFKKKKEEEISSLEKEIQNLNTEKEQKAKEKKDKQEEIEKKAEEFTKMLDDMKKIALDFSEDKKKAA